jgi:hypothetical protein
MAIPMRITWRSSRSCPRNPGESLRCRLSLTHIVVHLRIWKFQCSGRITAQPEARLKEEHDRPMEWRPQVDESEVAFPKTA